MYVIFGIPNTRRVMNLYVEESFCLPIFQIRYKEVKIRNCQKLISTVKAEHRFYTSINSRVRSEVAADLIAPVRDGSY